MKKLFAILTLTIVALACETKEHANAELKGLKDAKDNAARLAQKQSLGAAEEFGVDECDSYVKAYETCLADKVPLDSQPALRSTLEEQKSSWRKAAADPNRRDWLTGQCKDAMAMAKASMGQYGCSW